MSTAAGQENTVYDRETPGWSTMKIVRRKQGVLVSEVLKLASGQDRVPEARFSVDGRAKKMKGTEFQQALESGYPSALTTSHHIAKKELTKEQVRGG